MSEIRYTTNGSTPTATTGNVYTLSFTVSSTTTVKYRAFDNAGNAEAVQSQLISSTRPHRRARSAATVRHAPAPTTRAPSR